MPDYRHKTRGFTLREDAYARRCESGEFKADEFEAVVEPAPASPAEEVTAPAVNTPSAENPVTEPDEEESTSFFSRKAPPRKRR